MPKLGKKWVEEIMHQFVVPHNEKISLKKDYDPSFHIKSISKEEAAALLEAGIKDLAEQQDKLFAQRTYSLLIVLQAMDAAGKDGTIKHVMSGINPQGCHIVSFKAPSAEELNHDYLWRCIRALPERGKIGIFNRSYYEEVLVTRVHPEILERQQLPPGSKGKEIWARRYREINNFEEHLTNNGTIVLKFFLNVSREEQKRRFLQRIDLPEKNWKFSSADARERGYWKQYMEAYEDCFNHTSTKWAPWHIIPADHKPFTRLAVGYFIFRKLKELGLEYPTVTKEQKKELLQAKVILDQEE